MPMETALLLVALALVPAANELWLSAFAPVPMAVAVASCPAAVVVVTVLPLMIIEFCPVPSLTEAAAVACPLANSKAVASRVRLLARLLDLPLPLAVSCTAVHVFVCSFHTTR